MNSKTHLKMHLILIVHDNMTFELYIYILEFKNIESDITLKGKTKASPPPSANNDRHKT